MYTPKLYREDRVDVLHQAMRDIAAATIVCQGPDGLIASHVPIELDRDPAPHGRIRCHFARANPHAEIAAAAGELLLIFQGPQRYVTPSWYPSKPETGKVVPTWNYVAIHAYGTVEKSFSAPEELRRHLSAMTARHEAGFAQPWGLDDAPSDYIGMMCRAILGLEIRLSRIEGKWKVSQNRTPADRTGVIDGLRAEGDAASLQMADLVEAAANNGT
tara:strand:- start:675 stop:1322 length:648 start_codon:yes stop_codon:yes gene_type:complete